MECVHGDLSLRESVLCKRTFAEQKATNREQENNTVAWHRFRLEPRISVFDPKSMVAECSRR